MNRITVVSSDASISAQARAYAEYRVFAVVARHTRSVRGVRVVLRHAQDRGACDTLTCDVTVALEAAGSFRVRGTGPHAYAAINRAVERLGSSMERRVEQRLTPRRDESEATDASVV